MDDRDRVMLGYLIDHANAAISYARSRGRDWWKSNETLDAVLMRISQVGEMASKVSPSGLAAVPGVEWPKVKGARAVIIHDYQRIDVSIIRGVVSRQLPALITQVRRALVDDDKRRKAEDKAAQEATRASRAKPRVRRGFTTARSPRTTRQDK